uniref:RWP-RK domain-containing protein n=2 Tax=Cucumis melo TaxID=3656 RepID=A0A9I9CUB4_CUCME|nr:transcription factor [Cucumis melo subsp. melo]
MDSNPQTLHNIIPQFDFEWLHEDLFPLHNELDELPPLDNDELLDVNSRSLLPFHLDDNDVLEFDSEFLSRELEMVEIERNGFSSTWKEEEEEEEEEEGEKRLRLMGNNNGNKRRKGSFVLGLEEIRKYFHIPISKAAKEMNVGLTVLKRRCRQLNIMRWPHRKHKSLNSLIQNVKEMGLTNEVKGLEEHKRLLEEMPNMDLTHTVKRLRQACFKANYKKNRRLRSNNIASLHH